MSCCLLIDSSLFCASLFCATIFGFSESSTLSMWISSCLIVLQNNRSNVVPFTDAYSILKSKMWSRQILSNSIHGCHYFYVSVPKFQLLVPAVEWMKKKSWVNYNSKNWVPCIKKVCAHRILRPCGCWVLNLLNDIDLWYFNPVMCLTLCLLEHFSYFSRVFFPFVPSLPAPWHNQLGSLCLGKIIWHLSKEKYYQIHDQLFH